MKNKLYVFGGFAVYYFSWADAIHWYIPVTFSSQKHNSYNIRLCWSLSKKITVEKKVDKTTGSPIWTLSAHCVRGKRIFYSRMSWASYTDRSLSDWRLKRNTAQSMRWFFFFTFTRKVLILGFHLYFKCCFCCLRVHVNRSDTEVLMCQVSVVGQNPVRFKAWRFHVHSRETVNNIPTAK